MASPSVLTSVGYGCVALIAVEFYLLPIVIGWARRVPRLRAVAVIDLALGWTVIGWIVAATMALRPVPRSTPEPAHHRPAGRAPGALPAVEGATQPSQGLRQPEAAPPLVLPGSLQEPRRAG